MNLVVLGGNKNLLLINLHLKQHVRLFECLNKSIILDSLIREQHGLCAYCMRRIDNTSFTTIEYWLPIEINTEGALDYKNMLGVYDGGRKVNNSDYDEYHVLCCDASNGKRTITISPLILFSPCRKSNIVRVEEYILIRETKFLKGILAKYFI